MAYWIFIGKSSHMPVDVAKSDFMPVVRPLCVDGDWYKFVHEENAKQLITERDEAIAKLTFVRAALAELEQK